MAPKHGMVLKLKAGSGGEPTQQSKMPSAPAEQQGLPPLGNLFPTEQHKATCNSSSREADALC